MEYKKLILTLERGCYTILQYDGEKKQPKIRIYFSYADRAKKEALNHAREFGKELSKNLNIPLEEKL